jgi:hypothetical protein
VIYKYHQEEGKMKITNAGRDLRPDDLSGAKMVFCVAYATVRA